jgi:hypothetical protein
MSLKNIQNGVPFDEKLRKLGLVALHVETGELP